jgi:hypothetical protein
MVVHTCNPSTWEAWKEDHVCEASLGYCLKKTKRRKGEREEIKKKERVSWAICN